MVEQQRLDEIYRLAEEESDSDGREAHVVELLARYLKFRPEHAKAWMLYGDALRVLGRKEGALFALTRAFELAPKEHRGHVAVRMAMLLEKHSSPLEAKKWYELAADSLHGGASWLWILRGANLATLGEFQDAIKCFELVVAAQADEQDEALLNLGLVARAMGEYEKAAGYFRNALAITPDYREAMDALRGLEDMHATLNLIREIDVAMLH